MNKIIKQVIAIIALVLFSFGTVCLMLFLAAIRPFGLSSDIMAVITFSTLGSGLILFLVLYLFKAFPMQQQKEEKERKIREQYYEAMREEGRKILDSEENTPESDAITNSTEIEKEQNEQTEKTKEAGENSNQEDSNSK
jgi:hypothetical protein